MTLADTLLINGTDLQSLVTVMDFSGLHAPGTKRGGNVTIPGVPGDLYVAKVNAAYTFDVPVAIGYLNAGVTPATDALRRAQFLTNLRALEAVLDTGLLALTRRLTTSSGHADMTANGEYASGLAVTLANPIAGTTVLQFINLDGCWTDGSGGKHL